MANALEALRSLSVVVADTGDVKAMRELKPQDATTNPSLIFAAAQMPEYAHVIDGAVAYAKGAASDKNEQISKAMDKLAVDFGRQILEIVPGRVSTEVDARLSFDTDATVRKAREVIALYKESGISSDRILVKIASTWQGIQAARQLEAEGIHTNMTLIFSKIQAACASDAKATLISPFVGRITDFYKEKEKVASYPVESDPGVNSVKAIFNYFKMTNSATVVMGASFRSKEQVMALAGCDLLTVSPQLLNELAATDASKVVKALDATQFTPEPLIACTESNFYWEMCQDEMATFKLTEGIRKFNADQVKLEQMISKKF